MNKIPLLILSLSSVFLSVVLWYLVIEKPPALDPGVAAGRNYFRPSLRVKSSFSREVMEKFITAEVYRREEKLLKALALYHQAYDGFGLLKSKSGQAYSLLCLGIVNELLSYSEDSINYLKKAKDLFAELGDNKGLSHTLRWLANRYYHEGDFQQSLVVGREALILAEKTGDTTLQVKIIAKIGDNLLSLGEQTQAEKRYKDSIELSKKIGFLRGKTYGLYGLGKVYKYNLEKAEKVNLEALTIARQVGDKRRESRVLCSMGIGAVRQKNFKQAKNFFEQSRFLYSQIEDKRGKATVIVGRAFLHKKMNNYQKSADLLDIAFKEFHEVRDYYHQYETLLFKARLFRREGNFKEAEALLKRIGDLFTVLKSNVLVVKTLLELAHLKRHQGSFNESGQFYEEVLLLCEPIKNYGIMGESYVGLGRIDYEEGLMKSAQEYIQKGLRYAEKADDVRVEGVAYLYLAAIERRAGRVSKSMTYFEKAEKIFSKINNLNGLLKTQIGIACLKRELGDYQESEAILKDLYGQYSTTVRKKEMFSVLMNLAFINYIAGNCQKAEQESLEAIKIAEKYGDLRGQGIVYMGQATILSRQGYVLESAEKASKALELFRKTNDRIHEVIVLQILGGIYTLLGRYDDSANAFHTALSMGHDMNFSYGILLCLSGFGDLYCEMGDFKQALDYYKKAFLIADQSCYKRNKAYVLLRIGTIYYVLGQYDKATSSLDESLAMAKKLGDRSLEGEVQIEQGNFLLHKGEWWAARNALEQAVVLLEKVKNKVSESKALRILGSLEIAISNNEDTLSYYDIATQEAIKANSKSEQKRIGVSLGRHYLYVRNLKGAKEIMSSALSFFEEQDNRYERAILSRQLGRVEILYGNLQVAKQKLEESSKLFHELNIPRGIIKINRTFGEFMLRKGDYMSAKQYYEQSLEGALGLQNLGEQSKTLFMIAKMYIQMSRFQKAFEVIEEVTKIFERLGQRWNYFKCIVLRGEVYSKQQNFDQAVEMYSSALNYFEASPKSIDCFYTQGKLVMALAQKKQYAEAEKILDRLCMNVLESKNNYLICYLKIICGDYFLCKGDLKQAKDIYQEGSALAESENFKYLLAQFITRQKIIEGDKNKIFRKNQILMNLIKEMDIGPAVIQEWEDDLKSKTPKLFSQKV